MTLASKVPAEVKPKTPLEVELYRRVHQLPVERQQASLDALKAADAGGAGEHDLVSMLLEDGEPKFESEFSVGNLLALKPREVPAQRSPSFP
jgi:hypothetical protein